MIIYFSGTGNSKYCANELAKLTNEKTLSINDYLVNNNDNPIEVNGKLIIVTPTYAWRMPAFIEKWIKSTSFTNVNEVYFVLTCGGEIGNAAKYNIKICKEKNWNYKGTAPVKMPDNYIIMFNPISHEDAKKDFDNFPSLINKIANKINDNQDFDTPRNNIYDRIMSSIVNPLFNNSLKKKGFYAKESCDACGLCAKNCPLHNIEIKENKPCFGTNCTHCMKCISYCPKKAIEYKNKTEGKERYTIEDYMK